MMKHRFILLACSVVCVFSCSRIPDKSIFKPLSSDELAPIIKKDTLFADFYEGIQEDHFEIDI